MNTVLDVKEITSEKLEAMLSNKTKAVGDLNGWLSRHDSKEPEYKRVCNDIRDMNADIESIKTELGVRKKSLSKSLSEMKL